MTPHYAILLAATLALTGCGVETASTAATVAATKAKEAESAKATLDDVRGDLDAARKATAARNE